MFVCLLLLQLCVGVSCLVSGSVIMRLLCLFVCCTPIVCWCFMFSLWFCHDATIVFVCLLLLQLCVGVSCLVSGSVIMRLLCLFVCCTPIVCWCFMFSLWFCHNATIVFVCLLLLQLCVGVSCLVSGSVIMRLLCLFVCCYSNCVLVFHV